MQATKPQPHVPGWAEAEALINNALIPAWLGERSVRVVIEEVVPVVNALLQSANK